MESASPVEPAAPTGSLRPADWYSSTSASARQPTEILQSAFADAKIFFHAEMAADEHKTIWASDQNSIRDAELAVVAAREKYEGKGRSKARIWLANLSTRIGCYGNILDVLVQHHPEYTSLAWGAFKLVFTAVINHEELVKKLAKSLTSAAGLLPQSQLTLILYPTQDIQEAVARLYAAILLLFQKAIRWYKGHTIQHVFGSVCKPWNLSFADTDETITFYAAQVKDRADLALKAEVRDTHLEVVGIRTGVEDAVLDLRALRDEYIQLRQFIGLGFESLERISGSRTEDLRLDVRSLRQSIVQIHVNQLLSSGLWDHLPTSGESLEFCSAMRTRRGCQSLITREKMDVLQAWAENDGRQSLLLVECRSRIAGRDFVIDVLDLLRSSDLMVIWALRYQGYWQQSVSLTDVLKMLVFKAIENNQGRFLNDTVNPITVAHLREASNLRDWARVLSRSLRGLTRIFLILDDDLLLHAAETDRLSCVKLIKLLNAELGSGVKILTLTSALTQEFVRAEGNGKQLLALESKRKQPHQIKRRNRRTRQKR